MDATTVPITSHTGAHTHTLLLLRRTRLVADDDADGESADPLQTAAQLMTSTMVVRNTPAGAHVDSCSAQLLVRLQLCTMLCSLSAKRCITPAQRQEAALQRALHIRVSNLSCKQHRCLLTWLVSNWTVRHNSWTQIALCAGFSRVQRGGAARSRPEQHLWEGDVHI